MKKLLIASAIIASTLATFGASANWNTGWTYWTEAGGQLRDDSGSDSYSGKAYLFAGLTPSQYALLTSAATIWGGFTANGNSSTLKIGSESIGVSSWGALDAGGYEFLMDSKEFAVGSVYAAVIVTHEDDKGATDYYSANTMFGTATDTMLSGVSEVALGWGNAAGGTATTWIKAEAVPEPFSGTLALLGMAGIALRRRMKKAKKA